MRKFLDSTTSFFMIALIATLFYFAWITTIPNGFYHDEISFMLTAECLKLAGVDRHGEAWPLFSREFGSDHRLPVAPYLWFLMVKFFNMGPWGARIMTATFGYLAAIGLVFTFYRRKWIETKPAIWGALLFFVLTSSWFWSAHRFAAEPALVALVSLLQWVSFERFFHTKNLKWLAAVFISVALGPYVYRAFIPLAAFQGLSLFALIFFFPDFKKKKFAYIVPLLICGVFAVFVEWPILYDILFGEKVMSRVQIVTQESGQSFLVRFIKHIDGVFWFLKGDHNKRHHHGFMGEIHIFFFVPLLFFLKDLVQKKLGAFWIFSFVWALVAFIPASMTTDGVPHATRSLIALIPLMACCLKGVPTQNQKLMQVFMGLGVLFSISELVWYKSVYPSRGADAWRPIDEKLLNTKELPSVEQLGEIEGVYARYFYIKNTQDPQVCYSSRK